jgi:hypothetical protein
MKLNFIKVPNGLAPADPEAEERLKKIKNGKFIEGEFKQKRNYQFHKKWFALLSIAFDNWEAPELDSIHGKPEKSFDRFRKDIVILCGHYTQVVRLDGTIRVEADSVSFGAMSPEEFEKLYNQTITVLLKNVWNNTLNKDDVDKMVETYLQFAG